MGSTVLIINRNIIIFTKCQKWLLCICSIVTLKVIFKGICNLKLLYSGRHKNSDNSNIILDYSKYWSKTKVIRLGKAVLSELFQITSLWWRLKILLQSSEIKNMVNYWANEVVRLSGYVISTSTIASHVSLRQNCFKLHAFKFRVLALGLYDIFYLIVTRFFTKNFLIIFFINS